MTRVAFAKVESLQNDFIIVLSGSGLRRWTPARAAAVCDRRCGVGADGLILLGPETSRGIRFRLFNADGSRAEWSGNGVRGAGALLSSIQPRRREWRLLTDAGPIPVVTRRLSGQTVEATFSRPFPTISNAPRLRGVPDRAANPPLAVWAGNPHWVLLVEDFDLPWQDIGAECQRAPAARRTEGVNVEFVCIRSRRRIELRIFERGVGPTPASGSGALAAFAACHHRGLVDSAVRVLSPGGGQRAVREDDGDVHLTASAQIVCTGVWLDRPAHKSGRRS
jgi:diaminopimelate epimerase